ncbi:hypothetical protein ACQVP2_07275 [Methylobacterium aquaticum]|uniref:hypothetical protein n=1 Tax=Methylobacterium aquaticum TaxID=270351 RepID=UPI003D17465A
MFKLSICVLSLSLIATSALAETPDGFNFQQISAFDALYATAVDRGVRPPSRRKIRCEFESTAPEAAYFCEYAIYGTKMRFWSANPDGDITLITARPILHVTTTNWIIATSLVIATIDKSLSGEEVQSIAEKLASVGRNIDGIATATGKNGFYLAKITRDGLNFIAGPAFSRQ